MAKYVFVKNSLEYFDFMLIVCPLLHYFIYGCRNKNKIKNEKMRRELAEKIGKLKASEEKNGWIPWTVILSQKEILFSDNSFFKPDSQAV